MNTPQWLIQADVFGRGIEPIKAAIRRQGMAFAVVQPRPFLNGVVPVVGGRLLQDDDCVVFLGTYPLMRQIQLQTRWKPGGWCEAPRFDCARYYPEFGSFVLNHDGSIMSIDAALAESDALFRRHESDGQVFIRPLGLEKTFTGRCVNSSAFVSALQSARYARCGVLVARPRTVDREWRLVVSQRGVVAASQYRTSGELDVREGCPEEIRSFTEKVLVSTSYRPDPIFMLDVCESEGSMHVLELNSFSCSGLYACDPPAVVEEAARLACDAWEAWPEKGNIPAP
jgi:hypothetical protein